MNEEDLRVLNFASGLRFDKAINTGSTINGLTEKRIKQMLQNPSTSGRELGLASKTMKNFNGSYKRIIKYMSSILTYDHYIYPLLENPVDALTKREELQLDFFQKAVFIDRLRLKYYLPIFLEKMFTLGAVFLYKLEDKKSVAYQEFALEYCRIYSISEGVFRYEFDVSKINEESLIYYPKELQNAYTKYKNGDYSNDSKFDGSWYKVSDKGVAFSLDVEVLNQLGISVPPFASVIADALKVENAKEQMEEKDSIDNTVIIHSEVPLNENGVPTMDFDTVSKYQKVLKKNLPKGAVSITNPFNTKSVTLRGTGNTAEFNLLDETINQVHKSSGVSQMLFADDTNSSQALERSIETDVYWLYSFVLPLFENYINYELATASKKTATWKITFIQSSFFTREKDVNMAKEQLSFGGSRMIYLASTGLSPLEVANLLAFEQQFIDIDSLMVVKQNSNTLSSEDAEGGRPQSDDPTDTTLRIKDNE